MKPEKGAIYIVVPPMFALLRSQGQLKLQKQVKPVAVNFQKLSIVKRSSGRSSTAAAAYRLSIKLTDKRTGEIHDYRRKGGVISGEMIIPAEVPAGHPFRNIETLVNAVEKIEKRKDAQLMRECVVALPHELSHEQQRELVNDYVRENFTRHGMIAVVAHHSPDRRGDQRNHHAHILLTMRSVEGDGFGKKVRAWNDRKLHSQWKESWEQHLQRALLDAGHDTAAMELFYHRDDNPTPEIHQGPAVTALERKGVRTHVGDINRGIRAANDEYRKVVELQAEREHREAERREQAKKDAEVAQKAAQEAFEAKQRESYVPKPKTPQKPSQGDLDPEVGQVVVGELIEKQQRETKKGMMRWIARIRDAAGRVWRFISPDQDPLKGREVGDQLQLTQLPTEPRPVYQPKRGPDGEIFSFIRHTGNAPSFDVQDAPKAQQKQDPDHDQYRHRGPRMR